MARSDATALKNSGLDKFLYAQVGTELNGSELTILSVLARLGQDPWAEAARWVKQPKAMTIDRLTRSIAQMPLAPQALIDAPLTAARLVQLLPSQKIVPPGETRSINARLAADAALAAGGFDYRGRAAWSGSFPDHHAAA